MDIGEFLQMVTVTDGIQLNGTPVHNLSEAVVTVGHLADDTEPPGMRCTAPAQVLHAWGELSATDRQELWDLACAGRLDDDEAPWNHVHCESGEVTGEHCEWIGPKSETVLVEYMPVHLRSSHEAAGNEGTYPYNGSLRIRCCQGCAQDAVDSDPDWVDIVS